MTVFSKYLPLVAICAVGAGCAAPSTKSEAEASPPPAITTYLGNEGLMVASGNQKILFDPIFPNGFGVYQRVPLEMRRAIADGAPPFDGIDAIFISHMHPDHFDVEDIITYLEMHPETRLYAPQQAVDWMGEETDPASSIFERVTGIGLERGDAPLKFEIGDIKADVVRIPHSGWPGRADVSNLVFRVKLPGGETVMHMGDADANDSHYAMHPDHWTAIQTDTAYPPYWFFLSGPGRDILDNRLNAEDAVGVHVPMALPGPLVASGEAYFHKPGETRLVRQPKGNTPLGPSDE